MKTIISVIVAITLIGVAIILTKTGDAVPVANAQNVSIVDGTQIIEINAKGGYQPQKSIAEAGMSTIIRFNTQGTFDCSSSIRIPSMNITKSLPPSGTTDIDIGNGQLGTLSGSCGMGMYPFEIEFQ